MGCGKSEFAVTSLAAPVRVPEEVPATLDWFRSGANATRYSLNRTKRDERTGAGRRRTGNATAAARYGGGGRARLAFVIALALAAVLLIFSLRGVSWIELLGAVRRADGGGVLSRLPWFVCRTSCGGCAGVYLSRPKRRSPYSWHSG